MFLKKNNSAIQGRIGSAALSGAEPVTLKLVISTAHLKPASLTEINVEEYPTKVAEAPATGTVVDPHHEFVR